MQIAIFIAASALALVFTRPFFKRVLRVGHTPTNADMLIGSEAAVVAEIDNIAERGRVRARRPRLGGSQRGRIEDRKRRGS